MTKRLVLLAVEVDPSEYLDVDDETPADDSDEEAAAIVRSYVEDLNNVENYYITTVPLDKYSKQELTSDTVLQVFGPLFLYPANAD